MKTKLTLRHDKEQMQDIILALLSIKTVAIEHMETDETQRELVVVHRDRRYVQPWHHDPRLVKLEGSTAGKVMINVPATIARIGKSREAILNECNKRGSLEFAVKASILRTKRTK